MNRMEPVAESCEEFSGSRQRGPVPVKGIQNAVRGTGFKDEPAVAATAEGPIDVYSAGTGGKEVERLFRHDRGVPEFHRSQPQLGQGR
jgi:hypothetical protein